MKAIEHIGIAINDIEEAVKTYDRLLGTDCYKWKELKEKTENTVFFRTGPSKVELLGATAEDSVIGKYLSKQGEGMHHVAFEVEDIHAEMERLQQEGFTLLSEEPKHGADNKLVAFVHPKDNHGVLVELCQTIKE